MNDTPDHVKALYASLLMRRSGIERLKMGFEMFDTARAMARASFPPTVREGGDIRVHLFRRTYAADFDLPTRERVVRRLGRVRSTGEV